MRRKNNVKILKRNLQAEEDLSKIIEENREEPATSPLNDKEKEILSSAMQFYNTEAKEACIPASELAYIDMAASFDEVIDKFKKTKFNKVLVVNSSIDSVLGSISLMDVLEFIDHPKDFDTHKVIKDCTFVPESLNLPKVVSQMQYNKHSLAVVVDEYGGTSGIITIKDILSEFVGDIDESDSTDHKDSLIKKISQSKYQINPRVEIDQLLEIVPNFEYDLQGEEKDFETVSGLILQLAKKIPSVGEEIELSSNWKVKIIEVDPRKIKKVELEYVEESEDHDC